MNSSRTLVFLTTVLAVYTTAFAQTWTPPVGIPTPSFGITQSAPAAPSPWLAPAANFYYVDQTIPASTDTSNPYGTPAKPRKTIPTSLPAGAVVEVHGTYTYAHTSPHGIVSAGTATRPVFIRGISASARPTATACWELTGSYFIVENIEFTTCAGVVFLGGTDHGAMRTSDVHGTLTSGGVGVMSWDGRAVHDVVLFRNLIHDNGDVHASYDQDNHGIEVGWLASSVWVLENHLYRNSGDGLQINAGSYGAQSSTHHIYAGRNVAYENKQSGFWTKQAVDVIFSENESFRHRPSNSSMGACMGGQYGPEHVWFINNVVADCDFGIQLASDADQGWGKYQFFIGNVLMRIHDSDGGFQWGSAWQNCALSLPGGTYRYVLENTMYDIDSGVCVPNVKGKVFVYDNLISNVRTSGNSLSFDSPLMLDSSSGGRGNVFAPWYRLNVGGDLTTLGPTTLGPQSSNRIVASIGWVNPAASDFHLTATSAARDNGSMQVLGIWEYFQKRYGLSLGRDIYSASRVVGTYPDSGAVEYPAP